jgi:hypothetical protein
VLGVHGSGCLSHIGLWVTRIPELKLVNCLLASLVLTSGRGALAELGEQNMSSNSVETLV